MKNSNPNGLPSASKNGAPSPLSVLIDDIVGKGQGSVPLFDDIPQQPVEDYGKTTQPQPLTILNSEYQKPKYDGLSPVHITHGNDRGTILPPLGNIINKPTDRKH